MDIPFTTFMCVMLGSILRAVWGWLDSGEPFIKRRFIATMIFTIFAVAIPITSSMIASNMVVIGDFGLFGVALASLIAGWGADSGLKEFTKLAKKVNGTQK